MNGWCYLAPYEGKLRFNTSKELITMYVPLERDGAIKMVSVSVDLEDRIIYIAMDMYKLYEEELSKVEGIELRRGLNA